MSEEEKPKVTYADVENLLYICEIEVAEWQKELLVRLLNSTGPIGTMRIPTRYL